MQTVFYWFVVCLHIHIMETNCILCYLTQGMKLLPTGRKSSLAIFLYSCFVRIFACQCILFFIFGNLPCIFDPFLFRLAWELFYFDTSQICYDHYSLRLDFRKICMILYAIFFSCLILVVFLPPIMRLLYR